MEKVLDKLLDLVFKNRWLVAVISGFALAYWLHKDESTWKDTELYASTAFNRVQDRPTVWVGVGLAIAGYVFWVVLVHISHRHWREEGATHYKPREWVSRGNSCNVILSRNGPIRIEAGFNKSKWRIHPASRWTTLSDDFGSSRMTSERVKSPSQSIIWSQRDEPSRAT